MTLRKSLLAGGVLLLIVAAVYANLELRRDDGPEVRVEEVARRDLTATVSGSGTVRPYKEVDISANFMGRITRLTVAEGQAVSRGEFLLQIDPVPYESAVERAEAGLESSRTQLQLAEEDLEFARQNLDRKEGLYRQQLLSKEAYDQAVQQVRQAERAVEMRRQDVAQLRAQLQQVRHDLTKVTIDSPIDGIITRLNVEEGENVVTGTMNNPGTVIMTIADLSTVEAEIEIDETDVVAVEVGQPAIVRVDAFPDRELDAVVTEVGRSPIVGAGQQTDQAVVFKVVVRLEDELPGARPGLSCTADIVTARRDDALAVPIQALVLRNGDAEQEGALVVRDGRAFFVPIEIGIAGERHFEVLGGVEEGARIVIGPFDAIRELGDGDPVRLEADEEEVPR